MPFLIDKLEHVSIESFLIFLYLENFLGKHVLSAMYLKLFSFGPHSRKIFMMTTNSKADINVFQNVKDFKCTAFCFQSLVKKSAFNLFVIPL